MHFFAQPTRLPVPGKYRLNLTPRSRPAGRQTPDLHNEIRLPAVKSECRPAAEMAMKPSITSIAHIIPCDAKNFRRPRTIRCIDSTLCATFFHSSKSDTDVDVGSYSSSHVPTKRSTPFDLICISFPHNVFGPRIYEGDSRQRRHRSIELALY